MRKKSIQKVRNSLVQASLTKEKRKNSGLMFYEDSCKKYSYNDKNSDNEDK